MEDKHSSEAYSKGYKSESYENPYAANSVEYDDYERGWVQRIKRGLRCKVPKKERKPKTFQQKYQHSHWRQ